MKQTKSTARRTFNFCILAGGMLIPAFICHSLIIGEALPPLRAVKTGRIDVTSAVNWGLLVGVASSFLTMLIAGFACVSTGEMELSGE